MPLSGNEVVHGRTDEGDFVQRGGTVQLVQVDRWVVPPAVLVAVFTTVVIAPPGGAPARGLRVEALPGSARGAWLVRVGVEHAGTMGWSVPRGGRVRLDDGRGGSTAARLEGLPRSVWATATVPRYGDGPWRFAVEADGLHAEGRVVYDPQPAFRVGDDAELRAATGAAFAPDAQGISVRIEGGALVPEVPGVVRVRLPSASAATVDPWRFEPVDAMLVLDPSSARPDRCGLVTLRATVHGFAAHLIVRDASGAERARRRIPVRPGAIYLRTLAEPDADRAREGRVLLQAASPAQTAHVVFGDAEGRAVSWQSLRLSNDDASSAELAAPARSAWAVVSGTATFDPVLAAWAALPRDRAAALAPEPLGCDDADSWAAFRRAAWPDPSVRAPVVVYDGAPAALRAREERRERARNRAGVLAVLSLAALAAVLFAKGLTRDPEALRPVAIARRTRLLVALASTAVLALAGLLLFGTYLLRR